MEKQKVTKNEIDMLHGALLPKVLLFSLPLALSSILQLFFNAADSIVLGRFVGPEALAAVGSTTSFINLLLNLFIGLSVGVNVTVARYYAMNDERMVSDTVHTAITVGLVGGFLMLGVGWLSAETVLTAMGSPDDVLPLSVLYLRIYFLGLPAILVYNMGAAVLRSVGDTRRPLYYLTAAGITNIFLNLFFVIVCNLSVAGVAIATSVSNAISAALVVLALMRETSCLRFTPSHMKLESRILKRIFSVGLPAGVQGMCFSISNIVIQSSVNSFGSIVMAGSTASQNLEAFVYAAMNSVYQANLSFTSQNIGGGKYSRINRILLTCIFVVTVIGAGMGLSFCFFSRQLLGIYSTDAAVIEAGRSRMFMVAGTYFLCGIMDVLVGSLRGMGYAILPMLVTLFGVCVFRVFWIMTYFQQHMTIPVLFAGYPLSWIIAELVDLFCFFRIRKRFPRNDLPEPQSPEDGAAADSLE